MIYIAPIKGFLFSSKCSKTVVGWGSAPDPAGAAHSNLPDPLTVMGWDRNLMKPSLGSINTSPDRNPGKCRHQMGMRWITSFCLLLISLLATGLLTNVFRVFVAEQEIEDVVISFQSGHLVRHSGFLQQIYKWQKNIFKWLTKLQRRWLIAVCNVIFRRI